MGGDIEELKFNTAIAALMTLLNDIYAAGGVTREALSVYICLLSPFAPHLAEEMWQQIGQPRPIAEMGVWPSFDPAKTVDDTIEIPVQVNGKLKSRIEIPVGAEQDAVLEQARADERVINSRCALHSGNIPTYICVCGRLQISSCVLRSAFHSALFYGVQITCRPWNMTF